MNEIRRGSRSPIQNCSMMLDEVDSMLKLVTSRSSTQKMKYSPKEIPLEFSNAVKLLSYRVLNSSNVAVNYNMSRLKVQIPTNLGPGQYFKHDTKERLKFCPRLTIKNFESNL